MPTFAESAKASRTSAVGGALSTLGVKDVDRSTEVEQQPPDQEIVIAADPIKPPAYLQQDKIPPILVPKPAAAEIPAEKSDAPTTISGPSFLGLTDTSDTDQTNYLLEDSGPHRGRAWIVLLVLLAVLGGIAWWNRDAIKRAGFAIPFLHSASRQPPSSPQPANYASVTAAPSSQATKTTADDSDRFTTTDPGAAPDDAKNTTSPGGSATAATPSPNAPESKADDTAATESALSRQAQEARQKQADQASSGKAANERPLLAAADAKPAPAAGTPSDPNQNKLLLAGEKYLYGRGVPRSCEQAMIYFRAAADENNAPAMSHLAALYNSGECVKQDTGQAYGWLLRAHDADPNNTWIERDLEIMKRQMAAK